MESMFGSGVILRIIGCRRGAIDRAAGERIRARRLFVRALRSEELARLGRRGRGFAFPLQVASRLLGRVAHMEDVVVPPPGSRLAKSGSRPRQGHFRPWLAVRGAGGRRPFAPCPPRKRGKRLPRRRLPKSRRSNPGPRCQSDASATSILAERTMTNAIQPPSAFAVVFNRVLLVRLMRFASAFLRPPNIEEGQSCNQVLKSLWMRAG